MPNELRTQALTTLTSLANSKNKQAMEPFHKPQNGILDAYTHSWKNADPMISFPLSIRKDVRLLSLTAIKGWKSQHWFIWRVLSPSGPFQALTKITEKDQQDQ